MLNNDINFFVSLNFFKIFCFTVFCQQCINKWDLKKLGLLNFSKDVIIENEEWKNILKQSIKTIKLWNFSAKKQGWNWRNNRICLKYCKMCNLSLYVRNTHLVRTVDGASKISIGVHFYFVANQMEFECCTNGLIIYTTFKRVLNTFSLVSFDFEI